MSEMPQGKKLVVGNWKMMGDRAGAIALASALGEAVGPEDGLPDVVIAPPGVHLPLVADLIWESPVLLGAQDVSPEVNGAHTGDVSAEMLADLGVHYVIVGHSERRAAHGESHALVAAKAAAVHRAGMVAIICVGETRAERDEGRSFDVVRDQLLGSLPRGVTPYNTVIAYEPVWAIGAGQGATPMDIQAMHAFIRVNLQEKLAQPLAKSEDLRIVYGGSVRAATAAEILGTPHVAGVLVGGASLQAEEFLGIVRAATRSGDCASE